MWQEKQLKDLEAEIASVIISVSGCSSLIKLINESVSQGIQSTDSGKMTRPWSILPLVACEAVSGNYSDCLPAAAALHLLRAAAEILDDVEDADSQRSLAAMYGTALAVNTASLLIVTAEKSLAGLAQRKVSDRIIVQLVEQINRSYITACEGQHRDLSPPARGSLSEEEYLEITGMKSASVIECSCAVGALVANADRESFCKLSRLGYYMGMAAQIANDIQGIVTGKDIQKRKMTLPVIFALDHSADSKDLREEFFGGSTSPPDFSLIKHILYSSGAVHYSALKLELYKQQARNTLADLEQAGISSSHLNTFLE